mmetsp:Transcript_13869/g.35036  ORF Transcript_13869/g.35036 Transcript_13869/m.35036 type:complete len:329 (+) Transcript_13869:972-1958(+)
MSILIIQLIRPLRCMLHCCFGQVSARAYTITGVPGEENRRSALTGFSAMNEVTAVASSCSKPRRAFVASWWRDGAGAGARVFRVTEPLSRAEDGMGTLSGSGEASPNVVPANLVSCLDGGSGGGALWRAAAAAARAASLSTKGANFLPRLEFLRDLVGKAEDFGSDSLLSSTLEARWRTPVLLLLSYPLELPSKLLSPSTSAVAPLTSSRPQSVEPGLKYGTRSRPARGGEPPAARAAWRWASLAVTHASTRRSTIPSPSPWKAEGCWWSGCAEGAAAKAVAVRGMTGSTGNFASGENSVSYEERVTAPVGGAAAENTCAGMFGCLDA